MLERSKRTYHSCEKFQSLPTTFGSFPNRVVDRGHQRNTETSSLLHIRYVTMGFSSSVAQSSIDIQAPISVVFAILLHFAAYPDWNPFIVKITDITPTPSLQHPVAINTEFTLHCNYSDGTTSSTRERVTEVTALPSDDGEVGAGEVRKAVLANRYVGPLAVLGVVKGTRHQWLEQRAGDVTTRYRTEIVFRGVGAALVPLAQVQDGFQRMAEALKATAEAMA